MDDVDMDAPQISTLREEESPPPTQPKNPIRVRLVVKDKSKTASPAASSSQQKKGNDDDGDDEDDDQEDQLIDDDDASPNLPSGSKKSAEPGSSSSPKKKSATNKVSTATAKKRKNKRPPEEGRLREKVQQQPAAGTAPNLSPTMLLFDAGSLGASGDGGYQEEELPTYSRPPPKKKQKKAATPKEKKEKETEKPPVRKLKVKLVPTKVASDSAPWPLPPDNLEREDPDVLSEAVPATVASSPVINPVEEASLASHSPEPEISLPLPPPAVPAPVQEEINLEGTPIPVYPLPTKPFPVLPPPKVSSGFAPTIPLDRGGPKVRQWRVALREIRGIAGGRWFTRAWVGEKQSQFASEMKMNQEMRKAIADSGVSIPKLNPAMSASAPAGSKGKGKGKAGTASSLSVSAAPSRSESVGPEPGAGPSASAVRGPSKMRISQIPPPPSSEAGDSVLEADV